MAYGIFLRYYIAMSSRGHFNSMYRWPVDMQKEHSVAYDYQPLHNVREIRLRDRLQVIYELRKNYFDPTY